MEDLNENHPSLHLEPSWVTVAGQNYALVSFVSPDITRQKSSQLGMKIYGCFATKDDANAHVKRIQRSGDNIVDIFLMDMYNWAVIPPDVSQIEDHEYQQQFLQDLMKGYADNQRSAKEMFETRKQNVIRDGLDKHLEPNERIPKPSEPLSPPESMPTLSSVIEEDSTPGASGEGSSNDMLTEAEVAKKMFEAKSDPWLDRNVKK
jgi:hypothetical protein